MNEHGTHETSGCEQVRMLIPDVASGRALPAEAETVRTHAAGCSDCDAELALARALFESRVRSPEDLTDRVVAKLRHDRRLLRRPWWGVSAAAVAALALGIGMSSRGEVPTFDPLTAEIVLEEEDGELWLADDAVLAGAPVLDELSDEVLMDLLDALTAEPTGGQA